MSYADSAALSKDLEFRDRLSSCLSTEAQPKDDHLATLVLQAPSRGIDMFMPFISTAPGFDVAYGAGGSASIDDGMILSAVQAAWPSVAEIYPPADFPAAE
jgi:hypothetical protein